MSVWMIKAGRNGEQEQRAIDDGYSTIGWRMPDMSGIKTREEVKVLYEKCYPESKKRRAAIHVGQIWAFLEKIKEGDFILLPLKTQSAIAIGKMRGEYKYHNDMGDDMRHVRKVQWIKTDVPRASFDQDILYSLGALMTLCQIKRENIEERITKILKGENAIEKREPEGEEEEAVIDIEQAARDQILDYINQKFTGHDLARLLEAVLEVQGYVTKRSQPGPDGGVDILAGAGVMGFDNPKICVQVKSTRTPADVNVFRSLVGTIQSFNAEQGLLVSWGGFNRKVIEEARRHFFTIRLWDSGELLEALFKNYEKLPDAIQAELPLKRTWSLVLEE